MSKKIHLTDDVQRLVDRYLEVSDETFDELSNKALKDYLVNKFSSKQIHDILQRKKVDDHDIKDILKGSFGNWMDE